MQISNGCGSVPSHIMKSGLFPCASAKEKYNDTAASTSTVIKGTCKRIRGEVEKQSSQAGEAMRRRQKTAEDECHIKDWLILVLNRKNCSYDHIHAVRFNETVITVYYHDLSHLSRKIVTNSKQTFCTCCGDQK
jgi:hypothetical protein